MVIWAHLLQLLYEFPDGLTSIRNDLSMCDRAQEPDSPGVLEKAFNHKAVQDVEEWPIRIHEPGNVNEETVLLF